MRTLFSSLAVATLALGVFGCGTDTATVSTSQAAQVVADATPPTVGTYSPRAAEAFTSPVSGLFLRDNQKFVIVRLEGDKDVTQNGSYEVADQSSPFVIHEIRFSFEDGSAETYNYTFANRQLVLSKPRGLAPYAKLNRTSCGDGTPQACDFIVQPKCPAGQVLAVRNECLSCVNPETCEEIDLADGE
jgi:hypothetical protein